MARPGESGESGEGPKKLVARWRGLVLRDGEVGPTTLVQAIHSHSKILHIGYDLEEFIGDCPKIKANKNKNKNVILRTTTIPYSEWVGVCSAMGDTLQLSASMSNSLSKRIEDLSLSKNLNPGPAPPIPLTIPHLITHGRRMYFGIKITEEWLVEYAKKCGYDPDPRPSKSLFMTRGLAGLRKNSGIRTILPKTVFAQGTRIPPQPTKVTYPLRECEAHIIAICSDGETWFANRPSQAQVDGLKQIMGAEPMWWVEDG